MIEEGFVRTSLLIIYLFLLLTWHCLGWMRSESVAFQTFTALSTVDSLARGACLKSMLTASKPFSPTALERCAQPCALSRFRPQLAASRRRGRHLPAVISLSGGCERTSRSVPSFLAKIAIDLTSALGSRRAHRRGQPPSPPPEGAVRPCREAACPSFPLVRGLAAGFQVSAPPRAPASSLPSGALQNGACRRAPCEMLRAQGEGARRPAVHGPVHGDALPSAAEIPEA